MTDRTKKYYRTRFKSWKHRVSERLPGIVMKFYSIPGYIDYEKHVLLGSVIKDINNPFFSIMDNGKRVDQDSVLAYEVILEIQVSELFAFVNKNVA